jgi:hypothetical protein
MPCGLHLRPQRPHIRRQSRHRGAPQVRLVSQLVSAAGLLVDQQERDADRTAQE